MGVHTKSTSRRSALQFIGRALLVAALGFGGAELVGSSASEAGAKTKKVSTGLKFFSKGLSRVEKAGRAAQRKRGVIGKAGGILKNGSRATNRGVKGLNRGIGRASARVNQQIGKSSVGRAAQNGWRKAARFQNRTIDNAFRGCRGGPCNGVKGVTKFLAPF